MDNEKARLNNILKYSEIDNKDVMISSLRCKYFHGPVVYPLILTQTPNSHKYSLECINYCFKSMRAAICPEKKHQEFIANDFYPLDFHFSGIHGWYYNKEVDQA